MIDERETSEPIDLLAFFRDNCDSLVSEVDHMLEVFARHGVDDEGVRKLKESKQNYLAFRARMWGIE